MISLSTLQPFLDLHYFILKFCKFELRWSILIKRNYNITTTVKIVQRNKVVKKFEFKKDLKQCIMLINYDYLT